MRHPLPVLATRMPWKDIKTALEPLLAHKDRAGRGIEGADLFGPTLAVTGAGVSNAGRPRLPIRLMVSLLYLKHAFNESDESVFERWSETVVWVRLETGEKQVVQVHCNERVAIRIAAEPCGHDRDGMAEAPGGVRAGQPLNHDIVLVPGGDAFHTVEGNISLRAIASDA